MRPTNWKDAAKNRPDDFYPVKNPPARLYKYRSVAGDSTRWTESIIVENSLYFATRLKFNDPFDCRPRFTTTATAEQRRSYAKEALSRVGYKGRQLRIMLARGLAQGGVRYDIAIKDAIRHVEERLDRHVGVLCLSAKPDDLLMWSHYADSHRGICLTFEGRDGECPFHNIMPVRYQRNFAVCNPVVLPAAKVNELAIYTKSEHWAYEEEWRLTSANGPGTRGFPPEILTEVTLGVSISEASEELVRGWIQRHSTPIKLRRAVLQTEEYGITFRDL